MKIKTRKGENNQCLRKTQIRLAEKPRLTVTVRRPQPKISVIIPCYNVEKYIKQCLDSVLSQTLTDIEIICVNDGSADGTLPILKAYETLNERVFIIDKPNGGYGAAMNAGMAAANGKYVGIVESDDFIDPQMFETLYNLSQNGTVDVVKGNFYDYYAPANKVPRADINHERDRVIVLDRPFHITENTEMLWGHPSVWSGIYRRAFLVEHNVSFIEAKSGGWVDNPFFFETMLKAKSIVWVPAPLYYYRKTNESSSSNKQSNAILPFVRMMDNLSVLENSEYGNETDILRVTYARALMYLRGALFECDYENNFNAINEYAAKLFSNIREAVILQHYNLNDQHTFLEYLSPLKSIQAKFPRILIYNWLPFDNMWNWGGGVTVYCKSLIDTILTENPFTQIYFLSSGFAYKSTTTETFIRKIPNIFGDKVHQFEIVNSPVPAEQRYMFVNPLAALKNETLKDAVRQFMTAHGIFSAVHFNNIEGLSIDVLDLKKEFPQTEFIFSIHNYIPICVTGFYYMRHKRRSCSPAHTSEDCYACTRKDIGRDIARTTWERGFVGVDRKDCLSQRKWCSAFGFEALDDDAAPDKIIDFAKTCTEKINENCDTILAVSQRVYDIAAGEGFDKNKMVVSYIGTRVALEQTDRANAVPDDGLKIVFLGNDINYEEKGYPWFLESLEQVPAEYAAKIDLFLTVNVQEHAEIYEMCSNFRSITVKVKYTRDELKHILKGCHLGIVPVLWEDNLPQIAIEMVAYGVPVLTSSAGGAKELCDSELFVFEGGNTEDFISKLMHFVDVPEDLRAYWQHHHGLVTMKQHWNELKKYYKADMSEITLSSQDYYHLMLEHDFLVKNMSIREERFTPQFIVDDLRNKLYEAEEENHRLREEKSDMEKINGHITFHTDYNAYMGHVGADLFKITLKKFDFSNFYAEIRFNKLLNVDKAYSNIMRVSGTWLKKDDEYVLQLHQLDWVFDEPQISDWVFCYIRENSLCFFARYPGKSCSIAYDVLTLSTRADIKSATVEKLYEKTFISENELRPEDVFNTFAEYTALKTLKDAVTVGAEIKQEKAAEITSVATAANGDTAEQKMGRLASNENAL